MARDGSGNYSLATGQPVVTGTTISSTVENLMTADIAAALTQSLSKDGQTTPTAALPMGGFNHTGVADGTQRNHYASAGQVQDDSLLSANTVGGTADAITMSLVPALPALKNGLKLSFTPTNTNATATPTLSINGLTAKTIVKAGNVAVGAGDIATGIPCYVLYDGSTYFTLLNPATAFGVIPIALGGTAATTAANARTSLGLGSLATQSGTFSGTSSGTNTGDQTNISGNAATSSSCSGNAATATNVAASGITGATLAAGVTASSLTSFGASPVLGTPASGNLSNCTADGTVKVGFINIPRSTTTTTVASTDNGKCIAVSAAINIPISVFSAGDSVSIYNDSAASVNITISAGTLRLSGTTTTGTRALAARGTALCWFNVGGATPEVICSGPGVT